MCFITKILTYRRVAALLPALAAPYIVAFSQTNALGADSETGAVNLTPVVEDEITESIQPAATIRPVLNMFTLEAGSSHVADSYLSPITYRGWSAAFGYERLQAMKFNPHSWVMQLEARIELDRGRNLADNATAWRLDVSARWGMLRRWQDILIPNLTLALGGSTGIDGGAIYNPRNGNNPASAKLAWTVNITGYASWYFNPGGRLPILFRYQPTLPLAGVFFSPEYDELYYEIYLGNHSGLAHFAWPGNRFTMINYFSADLSLGNTILRLGYRNYLYSSKVDNLVTNVTTHAFVFGIGGEWISWNPRNGVSNDTRTFSAVY